jgi:hypothetical protein
MNRSTAISLPKKEVAVQVQQMSEETLQEAMRVMAANRKKKQ